MLTIHDRIEEFLAADLHDELSDVEREDLHVHLMECAACRALHKEEQVINKVMQSTLEHSKPIYGFEQRMLSAFRNRVPYRSRRVSGFFVNIIRSRLTQVAAAAAVLLALFQLGKILTGESSRNRQSAVSSAKEISAAPTQLPASNSYAAQAQVFGDAKTGETKAARSIDSLAASDGNAAMPAPAEAGASDEIQKPRAVESPLPAKLAAPMPPPVAGEADHASPVAAPADERKLVRNANVELEVRGFEQALESITAMAGDAGGYVATSSSQKQENGKLRGEIVVKVLPENLDDFLGKLRGLGDLKNQTLTTQDVTKQYFDTDARLRNARVLEERLVSMLEKNAGRVSDLLEVEKELGRVREQIEQMEGEIKFMETQVQFATVTIRLAEKEMNAPAAFLIKERVQLALFAPEVEKVYATVRGLASTGVQITNAALDRDDAGRVSARISLLVAPEESDEIIAKIRSLGRVANFQVQSERVARGGQGMSPEAKTEFDKVALDITISREEDEQARQQTTLSVRAPDVNAATKLLGELAARRSGKIRSSSFSRDPNGAESATVSLRLPVKNYAALMQSLAELGKLENVSVHREDRPAEQADAENAPADVTVTFYSQGNIVAPETGLSATLRRTLGQSAGALMWSLRMIGVALASIAPWAIILVAAIGIITGVRRSRRRRTP
jgi:Domain of unknown function (DUF4349)